MEISIMGDNLKKIIWCIAGFNQLKIEKLYKP